VSSRMLPWRLRECATITALCHGITAGVMEAASEHVRRRMFRECAIRVVREVLFVLLPFGGCCPALYWCGCCCWVGRLYVRDDGSLEPGTERRCLDIL